MKTDYFSKVRILDGGMGQLILSKGLKPKGSLWSGTALIDKKYHQMVIDSHLDFIKSGADVIVTNNFAGRRVRMAQNNVEELFDYANEKAGELALKAKEISKKNILIAGSLPAQNDTYVLDQRDKKIIEKGFYDQAKQYSDAVISVIRPWQIKAATKSGGYRQGKGLLEAIGRSMGPPRPPTLPCTKDEIEEAKQLLKQIGWI